MSKVKQVLAKAKEKIQAMRDSRTELSDEEFQQQILDPAWRMFKGRTDIKSKLMLLLNPDKPQTTTFLNKSQAHYVSVSNFVGGRWEEFNPMIEYAIQMCLSALGIEGKGIDSSVRLTGALSETKMLQHLGIQLRRDEK